MNRFTSLRNTLAITLCISFFSNCSKSDVQTSESTTDNSIKMERGANCTPERFIYDDSFTDISYVIRVPCFGEEAIFTTSARFRGSFVIAASCNYSNVGNARFTGTAIGQTTGHIYKIDISGHDQSTGNWNGTRSEMMKGTSTWDVVNLTTGQTYSNVKSSYHYVVNRNGTVVIDRLSDFSCQ